MSRFNDLRTALCGAAWQKTRITSQIVIKEEELIISVLNFNTS
jgi:hypothetical protein